MFLGSGISQSGQIALTRFCKIIETSPERGWWIATTSSVVFNVLVICLKFAMKSVPLLSGWTSLLNKPNVFGFHGRPTHSSLFQNWTMKAKTSERRQESQEKRLIMTQRKSTSWYVRGVKGTNGRRYGQRTSTQRKDIVSVLSSTLSHLYFLVLHT